MGKSYIAENIMREYEEKKKYKLKMQKKELAEFIEQNCSKCKNKQTQLCHIVKNIDNKFSCPFINIQIILTYQALLIYPPPFNYILVNSYKYYKAIFKNIQAQVEDNMVSMLSILFYPRKAYCLRVINARRL